MKKPLLSILILVCLALPLAACSRNGDGLNLNARNVEIIERLTIPWLEEDAEQEWVETRGWDGEAFGRYMVIINTFTDETHISYLIGFFNSLTLTASDQVLIDAARMPEIFRIVYRDGTTDFIQFHFTSMFYNDSFFRIADDDRGLRRTRELDYMLIRLHDDQGD